MIDTPAEYSEAVHAEQVRLSYSQTTTNAVGGALAGGVLSWVFWPVLASGHLIAWLACLWVTYGMKYVSGVLYKRRQGDHPTQFWSRIFVGLNFATGAVWGVAWLTFIPVGDPTYTVIVAAWMMGLASVTATGYAAHLASSSSITIPLLLPGIVQMFIIGSRVSVGVGIGACVGSAALFSVWIRVHKAMVEAIGLNLVLESEIARRKTVEKRLHALSIEDRLTGLANRRRFDEVLDIALRRARREEQPVSLIMIDVDYFKAFNDRYGHVAGDECLKMVAQAVDAAVKRPADLAARYGGEEFAVVLPSTDLEGAVGVAEEIRARVCALRIPHAGSGVADTDFVTLSAGVAVTSQADVTHPEELIQSADALLYQAKGEGRNRVARDHFVRILESTRNGDSVGGRCH